MLKNVHRLFVENMNPKLTQVSYRMNGRLDQIGSSDTIVISRVYYILEAFDRHNLSCIILSQIWYNCDTNWPKQGPDWYLCLTGAILVLTWDVRV